MAPMAAGTAAELQPKQAVAIAKAAASAAPSKAAQIVVAVSRAVPKSYRDVAVAICNLVPGSNRAILAALSSAFPELKTGIENALANYTGQSPSVGLTLDQTGVVTLVSFSGAVRGPSTDGPYVPLGNGVTPYQANNDGSGPVPPGGVTYANP
jgi:4-amino-4-deoxy-L-arabinose transferase-like glycosyltransferase